MKKKYTLKVPLQIKEEYISLYSARREYTFQLDENIEILKNVFVSTNGNILHKFLIPINSGENLIGKTDKNFYFQRWKKTLEQFLVCKYGSSLKLYSCDNINNYFTIHTPWFGYFSWVTTYLPRLLTAINKIPDAILIYPEEWDKISYVRESLLLFKDLKILKIPADHHIIIPKYALIPCRKWTSHFDQGMLEKMKSEMYDLLNIIPTTTPTKKIYISRKKAKRRKIPNEIELEILLKKFDIVSICFEDLSFSEQVTLMSETKLIIASHGAGLTNINFLQENSAVVELSPKLDNFNKFRFPFWRMAELLHLNYYSLFCDKTNHPTDEYEADIQVDLSELEKLITSLS
jgi:hypothetical protein